MPGSGADNPPGPAYCPGYEHSSRPRPRALHPLRQAPHLLCPRHPPALGPVAARRVVQSPGRGLAGGPVRPRRAARPAGGGLVDHPARPGSAARHGAPRVGLPACPPGVDGPGGGAHAGGGGRLHGPLPAVRVLPRAVPVAGRGDVRRRRPLRVDGAHPGIGHRGARVALLRHGLPAQPLLVVHLIAHLRGGLGPVACSARPVRGLVAGADRRAGVDPRPQLPAEHAALRPADELGLLPG